MLAVSSIPLFLQCPRAFYFKQTRPAPKTKTRKKQKPGKYAPQKTIVPVTASRMLESEWLGMRGQCKFIKEKGISYPAIFRKSARFKPTPEDILKLSLYSMLLDNCSEGRVANPSTGAILHVKITDSMRTGATTALEGAKNVLVSDFPPPARKGSYCSKCSFRQLCKSIPNAKILDDTEEWIIPESGSNDEPGAGTLPLYLQEQGAKIGISTNRFVVTKDGNTIGSVPLADVSQIVIYGNIQISSQALRKAFNRNIQILFFSSRGSFSGIAKGLSTYNSKLKPAQFHAIENPKAVEHISKRLVESKVANCRTFLMRNSSASEEAKSMKRIIEKIKISNDTSSLRGYEGSAARLYFSSLGTLLKSKAVNNGFGFSGRSRRPPRDPVNALLSFGYSLLSKEFTVALESIGLDPMHGFLHASRSRRPALALDLMEPFRPLISDSIAIGVLNKGVFSKHDFTIGENGCYLTSEARKRYIKHYERRLNTKINYNNTTTLSYRNAIRKSVQDIRAYLLGTQPEFQPLKVK